MKGYIIGIDQSTSGTKIVLVNEKGHIEFKQAIEHKQHYPNPGWVEHDPIEIFDHCLLLIKSCIQYAQQKKETIVGLSITNQRETVVFWDDKTKEPLCNAIVWQCRRSTKICSDLKDYSKRIEEKTGLHLDPYFSASKIMWALQNDENVKRCAKNNTLRIGTIDTWLIYKLTGGKVFATDHTNASRTMLYNISTNTWDDELLSLFNVRHDMLPFILSSNDMFGYTQTNIVGTSILITGVIGDSQGALFGQQCFEEGTGKVTYGTGSSILLYTGDKQVRSSHGFLTSIAWSMDGQIKYALEGVINSSGDTLKWLKDNLQLYDDDDNIDNIIESIDSTEGVYLIPAFAGLGSPYWKPDAKGSIVGLTKKTKKAHIIRAAVESMAYQVADLLQIMQKETGHDLKQLNVDGGPTNNSFLMQMQANLIQTDIVTSHFQELSVLGAVYLGGLSLKLWNHISDLEKLKTIDRRFIKIINKQQAADMISHWQKTVISHT